MKPLALGLDIDGVITEIPQRFATLTQQLMKSGGDVRIVTSRSYQGRLETERELKRYGIKYSELFFLPPISMAQKLCPHPQLNWFEKYLWQKADYAIKNGLSFFVDDDAIVEQMFMTFAPEITFIRFPESMVWDEFME